MEGEDNGKEIHLQPFILQVILYLTKKFTKDQCRRKNNGKKWHVDNISAMTNLLNTIYVLDLSVHWTDYYTLPQCLIITFSHSLAQQLWGLIFAFD